MMTGFYLRAGTDLEHVALRVGHWQMDKFPTFLVRGHLKTGPFYHRSIGFVDFQLTIFSDSSI